MNLIVALDAVSALGFLAAFICASRLPVRDLIWLPKMFIMLCLGIYVTVGVFNILEHAGVTSRFDVLEDYLELLFLPFFIFFLYSLSMGRELERRGRIEAELRAAREDMLGERAKSDAIVSSLGDGVSIQGRDLRVLYQNEVHKGLVGDHVGEYCYKAYEGRDAACEDCPVLMAFEDGQVHVDQRSTVKDGKPLHVEITASPVRDASGEIVSGIELVRDVSKRKEIENKVRQSQEMLDMILDATPYGIVIMDTDKTIVHANGAALKLMGYERVGELVGRVCHGNVCPAEEGKCPILDLGQELDRSERTIIHKDGHSIPILKTVVPIDFYGERLLLEAFVDITERKQAEDGLKAALKEKDVLLHEVHHRVKNNMAVISSLIRMQAKEMDSEGDASRLLDTQARIRSMSIVHNLLYRSPDVANVKLKTYVRELEKNLYQLFNTAPSLIRLSIDMGDISLGMDDAIPCGLIINELLMNSLKHAFPEGEPGQMKVAFHEEGKEYVLVVEDNGVGMPEGLAPETAETLGLQLIKALADQLDARMEISRNGGASYTFRFDQ